ncbi:MAG: hypothetical protein Q9169_008005, partial [Polycauliona sp. 2 TL-2023]
MSFKGKGPDHAREALIRANQSLLESGQGADMNVITTHGSKKYHSAFVCPRSSVLSAAYGGSFNEGVTKTIDLSEDPPFQVDRMMQYFYLLDYPDPKGELDILEAHAQMYILGEKYNVSDLKEVAAGKFAHWCAKLGQALRDKERRLLPCFLKFVPLAFNSLPGMHHSLQGPLVTALVTYLTTPSAMGQDAMIQDAGYKET